MRTKDPILSYRNALKIDLNQVIGLYFYNLQRLRIFMWMVESWYVFCLSEMWNKKGYGERRSRMRKKLTFLCVLLVGIVGISSCRSYVGYDFYPGTPHFERTHPDRVLLLRNRPQRNHIELGEVWIRPKRRMSRYFVGSMLREKAARMGADALVITVDEYFRDHVAVHRYGRGTMIYRERLIVGVAIRFR
jgi:hypothetical protein